MTTPQKYARQHLRSAATRFACFRALETAAASHQQLNTAELGEIIGRNHHTVANALATSPRLRSHPALRTAYTMQSRTGYTPVGVDIQMATPL